jgi:hypothetical protein
MQKKLPLFSFAVIFLVGTSPATAGVYSDDLSRCLVSSTTAKDKIDLVRWLVSTMSLHPDVSKVISVNAQQRTEIDKSVALILQRLLTEKCRNQTLIALKNEGQAAIATSFEVLGKVAAEELFANPSVLKGFENLGKYIDEKKINEVLGGGK